MTRTAWLGSTTLCCLASVGSIAGCSRDEGGGSRGRETPGESAQCPETTSAECVTIRADITELETRRDQALADGDSAAVARLSLEINYKSERLRLLAEGELSPERYAELDSKYEQLATLLESELAASTTTDVNKQMKKLGGLIYHPLEIDAVSRVFKDFGELYVAPSGKAPTGEALYEEVAVPLPWAGYWYPLAGKELFEGDQAPLVKLDRVMERLGRPTSTAAKERDFADFAAEDSWEGRCFAWATASVVTPEPTQSVEVEGVTFTVQDQKALLVKAHELYPTKFYGIRYDGDPVTDGTLQDIRPEAFHRLAIAMLSEQKHPFVIDDDPGIEVWSKPVYRLRWSIQPDPERPNAYIVDAFPFIISQRPNETDQPTGVHDRTAPAYRYRLFVDPKTNVDGKHKVIAGEWIGDSRKSHPDSISVAQPGGPIGSSNTEINQALDVVRRIVGLED